MYIYNYWVLKRRSGNNRPLLLPKSDDGDLLGRQQEQADLEKLKMFVQLRQDLERVSSNNKIIINLKIIFIVLIIKFNFVIRYEIYVTWLAEEKNFLGIY